MPVLLFVMVAEFWAITGFSFRFWPSRASPSAASNVQGSVRFAKRLPCFQVLTSLASSVRASWAWEQR